MPSALSIPSSPAYPSLNLAQAVAILLRFQSTQLQPSANSYATTGHARLDV